MLFAFIVLLCGVCATVALAQSPARAVVFAKPAGVVVAVNTPEKVFRDVAVDEEGARSSVAPKAATKPSTKSSKNSAVPPKPARKPAHGIPADAGNKALDENPEQQSAASAASKEAGETESSPNTPTADGTDEATGDEPVARTETSSADTADEGDEDAAAASSSGEDTGGNWLQTETPDELIFAVQRIPYILSPGMPGAVVGDRYYVPVRELAESFEIYVDPADQSADGVLRGYVRSQDNKFVIDPVEGFYELNGERKPLPQASVMADPFGDGEIYADTAFVSVLWPVDLTVNVSALVLDVKTRDKLPFELSIEREKSRQMLEARKKFAPSKSELPFVPNPYKFLGLPSLDLETEYDWDTEVKRLTGRTTVTGLQDIMGFTADYSASFPFENSALHSPSSARLRFDRKAAGDDTLFLGVKEIMAGDVRAPQRSLVDSSSTGRGFAFTTSSSHIDTEFDEITVEGTGLPGWEVEVYLNDILIEFGTVDNVGEYRFENIPITVGNNQVRVILYGPQGQIEEKVENYQISSSMLKPGKTEVSGGIVDADRSLIVAGRKNQNRSRGMAESMYVAHGLNERLTMFGSAARLPTTEGDRKYVSAGAMATLGNSFGQAEVYREVGGGHAVDLRVATKLMGLRLNLQGAFYNYFASPDAGMGIGLKTFEGKAQVSSNMRTPVGAMGLKLTVDQNESRKSHPSTDVTFQESLGFKGIRLTNDTRSSFLNYRHQSSSGSLSATVRMKQWQFGSQFDYDIFPGRHFTGTSASVRYNTDDGFSASVNAQHSFINSTYAAGAQVGYDFGKVLGSLDVGWENDGNYSVVLRGSTSIGPFGPNGRYTADSKKLTRLAPVQGRIFLDKDGDRTFSEGDEPVPGARILVNRHSFIDSNADENGVVVVPNAVADTIANVEVEKTSLEDPYYKPVIEGYSTIPRAGSMPSFEFPIVETGAIDGTARRADGQPLQGMKLQLVDGWNRVVMTTETAYDGFYTFEFVEPGVYTIRADSSYKVDIEPVTVTVGGDDDLFSSGIDVQLADRPEAVDGGIDGALKDESGKPVPGVALQLVNEEGVVIAATTTTDEGLYDFEGVPAGAYVVIADPSSGINVPPETATVTSEDPFVTGADLTLQEQAKEVEGVPLEGVEAEKLLLPLFRRTSAVKESGGVAHTYHEPHGTLKPAPLPKEGKVSAFIKRVRIGEHPDKIRLVLDLSGPITYRIGSSDKGHAVTVDMPGVAWEAGTQWRGFSTHVITSFDTEALPGGGTRLTIRGRDAIRMGLNGVLGPDDKGYGHRLFIDVQPQ